METTSTEQSANGQGTSKGFFQCNECKRSYTRVDHLARHVRSHMQEKPFECQVCNKAFGRPDLLKRHAQCHDQDGSNKRQKRQITQSSRVSQACKACATAKLKCEDEKPCKRCQTRKIECEWNPSPHTRSHNTSITKERPDPSHHYRHSLEMLIDKESAPQALPPQQDIVMDDMDMGGMPPVIAQFPTPEATLQAASTPSVAPYDTGNIQPTGIDENGFSDFLRDVLMSNGEPLCVTEPEGWQQPNDIVHRDVLDFANGGNWDFDTTDYTLLEGFNGRGLDIADLFQEQVDFSHQPDRSFQPRPISQPQEGTETPKGVALGTDAFRKSSLARWLPAKQDHAYAEQHHLSLPSQPPDSPEARLTLERRLLQDKLEQSTRDKILAMVLNTCQPANIPRVVASFPTAALLDDLLQSFFIRHNSQIESFVHFPSFSPNAQRGEVLTAMIATGAVLTGIQPLRKLGFALSEAVRLTIPSRCEEANTNTRELWMLQAFILQLGVGLWSGNRRKTELAESHQQLLFTMIRRAAKFQRSRQSPIIPLLQDSGDVLKRKWLEWVERESFRRLAFHTFLYDAQSSMSLLVNPLISYAELSLALPESLDLWNAETAEQWKMNYLSRPAMANDRLPCAIDFIQDPALLAPVRGYCDLHFSSLIALHAFWGMIWEYIQMNSVKKTRHRDSNSSLFMNLRHQDLRQTLHYFQMSISEWETQPSPETTLMVEILNMYLHLSLEEIQLFAGKEDKDEARRVFPSLLQWIESTTSRQAIWHAGQILRVAKCFPKNRLRNYYAIAVYHASLAFWAFGVISQAHSTRKPSMDTSAFAMGGSQRPVLLDGEETPDLKRFIALGRSDPSICALGSTPAGPTTVPLADPEAVMNVMLETLRGNFDEAQDEQLPPLVDNLVHLMRDLGKAAGAVGR